MKDNRCPECLAQNPPQALYCEECESPLVAQPAPVGNGSHARLALHQKPSLPAALDHMPSSPVLPAIPEAPSATPTPALQDPAPDTGDAVDSDDEKHYIVLGDDCDVCRTFSRIGFPAGRPPSLPLPGCRAAGGCRCSLPAAGHSGHQSVSALPELAALEALRAGGIADNTGQSLLYDRTTWLFTAEAFSAFASVAIAEAGRRNGSLSLFLVSLDGASEQTEVGRIQATAKALHRTLRTSDIIGHVGPHQFAMVAQAVNEAGATRLSQRIDAQLAKTTARMKLDIPLTVSQGIAMLRQDATFADLMQGAEAALASATADGGNCARFAGAGERVQTTAAA